jgi:hypothetical protein
MRTQTNWQRIGSLVVMTIALLFIVDIPASAQKTPVNDTGVANSGNTSKRTNGLDIDLMTQAEILSFLQTKMGDKPFQNAGFEETRRELVELIKARGIDFLYSVDLKDFNRKLQEHGGLKREIIFALRDNYGAPTKQNWLMGAWNLGTIGAGNVGTLTLNANGTYVWEAGTKDSTSGKWRKATSEEMKSQGGEGIVLLKAKSGYDWIVKKDRRTTRTGEWIFIDGLDTRQINEYGSRGGKK